MKLYKGGAEQPTTNPHERTKILVEKFLEDPHIDIWPKLRLRGSRRSSERLRAQSLQTYTLVLGGVAVFAYVFAHKEGLGARARHQAREFKVGVVSPEEGVIALTGQILAKRRRGLLGIRGSETEISVLPDQPDDNASIQKIETAFADPEEQ